MGKKKTTKNSVPSGTKRQFIRQQLVANTAISDEEIIANWNGVYPDVELKMRVVKRERTLVNKLNQYDEKQGLQEFFSSQATLLLEQYRHIEKLLGPPDSNWTWVGEHCEVLLRDSIRKVLPPSLAIAKGYIHGIRKGNAGIERCPEIDILIYDREKFSPLFSMGEFVIVYPESVVAAIQVKRTLDATTLPKAIQNVVDGKCHIRDTCRLNASTTVRNIFSAVVTFEEGIEKKNDTELSASYRSAIAPNITDFRDGFLLPDYVGSLSKLFLTFTGVNVNAMGYQAFSSIDQNGRNVALSVLLFLLMKKIRPYGLHLPPAFPEKMKVLDYFKVWEKPESQDGGDAEPTNAEDATESES